MVSAIRGIAAAVFSIGLAVMFIGGAQPRNAGAQAVSGRQRAVFTRGFQDVAAKLSGRRRLSARQMDAFVQVAKLTASDKVAGVEQAVGVGATVALSGDGDTALIGAWASGPSGPRTMTSMAAGPQLARRGYSADRARRGCSRVPRRHPAMLMAIPRLAIASRCRATGAQPDRRPERRSERRPDRLGVGVHEIRINLDTAGPQAHPPGGRQHGWRRVRQQRRALARRRQRAGGGAQ